MAHGACRLHGSDVASMPISEGEGEAKAAAAKAKHIQRTSTVFPQCQTPARLKTHGVSSPMDPAIANSGAGRVDGARARGRREGEGESESGGVSDSVTPRCCVRIRQ
jgi:hypothetical protein